MDTKTVLKLGGLFFAGGVLGAAVGFSVGVKQGFNKAWLDANEELEDQEELLMKRYKVGRYADPREFTVDLTDTVETLKDEAKEILEKSTDVRVTVDPEELERLRQHVENQEYADIKTGNVFVQYGDKEVHLDREEDTTPGPNVEDPEPIVISELEFMQEEEFQTITLEWYAGDRTLANENDEVIADVEGTVGINNLNLIGPSLTVLYVRNPRLETVFEIALRLGTYAETVMGLDEPLDNERPRRRSRGLGE